MSVRPSVRIEQLGSHWKDFNEILGTFRKAVEKIQLSLKSGKNNVRVLYMKTDVHLW
jgi:hypothetical protein